MIYCSIMVVMYHFYFIKCFRLYLDAVGIELFFIFDFELFSCESSDERPLPTIVLELHEYNMGAACISVMGLKLFDAIICIHGLSNSHSEVLLDCWKAHRAWVWSYCPATKFHFGWISVQNQKANVVCRDLSDNLDHDYIIYI